MLSFVGFVTSGGFLSSLAPGATKPPPPPQQQQPAPPQVKPPRVRRSPSKTSVASLPHDHGRGPQQQQQQQQQRRRRSATATSAPPAQRPRRPGDKARLSVAQLELLAEALEPATPLAARRSLPLVPSVSPTPSEYHLARSISLERVPAAVATAAAAAPSPVSRSETASVKEDDFASAVSDVEELQARLLELSTTASDADPADAPATGVALAQAWLLRRGKAGALEPVCTVATFADFRRYWTVLCSIDSSMIGSVLQMARADAAESDKGSAATGSWMLRFASEPELIASVWADVLLAMMGFVDDSDHPLTTTATSAELFLGSDSSCLRVWVSQPPDDRTRERLCGALGLAADVQLAYESSR